MSLAQDIKELFGGENPAALGRRVRRAGLAADLTAVATFNIFQVIGGDVMLTGFYGKVTTVIGGGAATLIVTHTPTGGAANAMCATSISIAADAVNTLYTWDGTLAGVLQPLGVAAVGVGNNVASFSAGNNIVVPGIIGIAVAVASTGVIDWILHYIPLDTRCRVIAL